MPFDWAVQQLRLSIFSNEPVSVTEQDWKTLTGQDEAETRTALPGGKQYAGKSFGGLFSIAYSGTRADILLDVDATTEDLTEDQKLPCIGKWEKLSASFPGIIEPFLEHVKFPIVRIAFGAILACPVPSKEDAYKLLDELLDSVDIDPKNMRELIYRINWPQMSKVIPDLELNRITNWSAVNVTRKLLQMTGAEMSVAAAGPLLQAVRLDIDHSTAQGNIAPFEKAQRVPIFQELVKMAGENAEAGECP